MSQLTVPPMAPTATPYPTSPRYMRHPPFVSCNGSHWDQLAPLTSCWVLSAVVSPGSTGRHVLGMNGHLKDSSPTENKPKRLSPYPSGLVHQPTNQPTADMYSSAIAHTIPFSYFL